MSGNKAISLAAAFALLVSAGCSDDDSQSNNNQGLDAEVGNDVQTQHDAQTQQDAAVQSDSGTQGCTGDPITVPGALGACCRDNGDCEGTSAVCLSGYCTVQMCADDSDCGNAVWGPFPGGTPFHCNTNQINFIPFCAPGSLQDCGGAGDAACPTGEICTLGWNEESTSQTGDAFRGVCMTEMGGAGVGAPGDACDEHADPFEYQCRTPGYLFSSCISRLCTQACDPANPTNTCPAGLECIGPLAFDTNSGLISGGGVCGGALCGRMEFTGDPENDVQIPGLDSECSATEVCVPSFVTGVDGDVYEFRCMSEVVGYGAPGDACEQAEKYGQYCNHGTLCLQQQPTYSTGGQICQVDEDCATDEVCVDHHILPSRCAPKPDPGFCSRSCRTDTDCGLINGEPAYCLELSQDMPNGQQGFITACYPQAELWTTLPATCGSESDCDGGTGEGCLLVSFHSEMKVCETTVSQDATGVDCSVGGVGACQADEACVEDTEAATFRCTGVKSAGMACDPAAGDCLSGWCVDTAFETGDATTPTNTFCSAPCVVTGDCGPNQVCTNLILAENDPALDSDDVVTGLCQTLVVALGTGCTPGGCSGGQTCDTATGRCYTSTAQWGGPCTDDAQCPLNGQCDTDAPGGLCYLPGCDPANGAADCGGGDTWCSGENVVGVCLEGCATTADCLRSAEGYTCTAGACVAP